MTDEELTAAFLTMVDKHHADAVARPHWWSGCTARRNGMGCALCTGYEHTQHNRTQPGWSLYQPYGPRWRRHVRRTLARAWEKRLRMTT